MDKEYDIRVNPPSVTLFETFESNRPLICNYHQLSSNKIRETFCEGLK